MDVFDEIALEWNQYRNFPISCLKFFLPYLKKNQIALDAGCGNGRNLLEIAKRCSFVYGIDSSNEMVKHALLNKERKEIKNAELKEGNILDLKFQDSFFNSIFCTAVLHHLRTKTERERAFSEFYRVLKPNSFLFLSVWNYYQRKFKDSQKDNFIKWKTTGGSISSRYYHFYEEEEILSLTFDAGFEFYELFYEKEGRKVNRVGAANLCCIFTKS